MVFIGTKVWVYALSAQDHSKKNVAVELIAKSYREDSICVSSQVLKEFANFAFKKTRKSASDINNMISKIGAYTFVADSKELIAEGVIGKETWQVGFYDALIIAAANKMGCTTVFTEDLNNGQKYGNVVAVNPFQGGA